MQAMLGGRSHLRLFEMLDWLWPADTPKPRLLSESSYIRAPYVFAQSLTLASAGNTVVDVVSIAHAPESLWATLMPDTDLYVSFPCLLPSVAALFPSPTRTKSLEHTLSLNTRFPLFLWAQCRS
jgi:hypothetical protein